MTKADIINKIAESTGLQKKDVSVVVESFMENIKDSLLSNKEMFTCVDLEVLSLSIAPPKQHVIS